MAAEKCNESCPLGFTGEDRTILTTVKVKVDGLEASLPDIQRRLLKLEVDHVNRKDIEDVMSCIDEKSNQAEIDRHNSEIDRRFKEQKDEIVDLKNDVKSIQATIWKAMGACAAISSISFILVKLFIK